MMGEKNAIRQIRVYFLYTTDFFLASLRSCVMSLQN